jgi:hypothetical protein
MYELLKKGRLHNLSIKSQYDLFDKIVNCRSDAESENKTVSSAYSKTKSFK